MAGLPIIAIDPGHNCKPDIGASYGKYSEDEIALDVANHLDIICRSQNIKAIWCQPESANSVLDSLQQRCETSNECGATLYVSIHCNVNIPTNGARGCETYAISTAGKAVAANINRELTKLGFKDRGVKTTLDAGVPPYVIRNTNAIAVLTEICFLDATEDTKILNKVGLKAIAQAIFNGLTHGTSFDSQSDNHANDPVISPKPSSLLVNAAKYYKDLPHQVEALTWLDDQLTPLQLLDFKSRYTPDIVMGQLVVATPKPVKSNRTVADWIANGNGSTSGVKGLSDQIIAEMGETVLNRFTHPRFQPSNTCDPYFHTEMIKKLNEALMDHYLPGVTMQVNSGYRSPVRQFVLREFFEQGKHGITAVARVGTGNHERGLAIDLENANDWQMTLLALGEWHWQGVGDPMHFDLNIDSNVPQQAIEAYQRLANRNGHKLAEDGIWGESTKQSMLKAPCDGW